MKRILISLLTITLVSAVAVGATRAFFTDPEKSIGNTFSAGTIDISVAGQNPWNKTYPMLLDKPSQTNYINFTIENVGNNGANVWKRINNVTADGGTTAYLCTCGGSSVNVSSEPECYEGTNGCTQTYVERDDLDSYMVYDLYVCKGQVGVGDCKVEGTDPASGKPTIGLGWHAIIPEANQVRVDNVDGIWIRLNDLDLLPTEQLAVSQSYHLTAWNDAGEPEITNWAQGDKMMFDIELEARQLTAPAPVTEGSGLLTLQQKNTTTWDIVSPGASGTLTYNVSGATFNYDFYASGLDNVDYSLIYYADPWPGNHLGALIGTYTASGGIINVTGQIKELNMNLPNPADANYPAGAKIWLVPSSAYSSGTQSVTSWGAGKYLFEMNLITYDDTEV